MIIKNLENKVKLAKTVSISAMILSLLVVVLAFIFASFEIDKVRNTIYVLNSEAVPMSASSTDPMLYRDLEYKNQIEQYHSLFFNLVPDEKQIEYNLHKAMYLIDETGMQQYNNLKEKGYYTQILSSSSVLTVQMDSIILIQSDKKWRYYGKQKIERKSSSVIRSLITEGSYIDIPRSANNVHGVLLSNWKTIENKDLEAREKSSI